MMVLSRPGLSQPPTAPSLPRASRLWWVAVSVALAGCVDLFGPSTLETPPLGELAFDGLYSDLKPGGLVYVIGAPSDTAFRLAKGQRIPIEITVTSGDREGAGLYRAFCPYTDRGQHYDCFRFDIYMLPGRDARALAGRVAAIGGRFDLMSATGSLAGVTLFAPDHLVSRAREAGSWPGVYYTELSFPFCMVEPGTVCQPLQMFLRVPLPVDSGSALPGDGMLQVRTGDTVVATYHQPTGQVLQARAVVP